MGQRFMPSSTPQTKAKNQLLVDRLINDFPQFKFELGDSYKWSPDEKGIHYTSGYNLEDSFDLLHELGHALLSHKNYFQDIELIKMERDAWVKAREVAVSYKIDIDEDYIEDALDGYRDWLHSRSICPECMATGLQSRKTNHYMCLSCEMKWTSNDARTCGLRRWIKK